MIQKVPNSKNVTLSGVYIIWNVYDGAGDISIRRYIAVIICNHNHFCEPSLCRFLLVEALNDVYWLLTRLRLPSYGEVYLFTLSSRSLSVSTTCLTCKTIKWCREVWRGGCACILHPSGGCIRRTMGAFGARVSLIAASCAWNSTRQRRVAT